MQLQALEWPTLVSGHYVIDETDELPFPTPAHGQIAVEQRRFLHPMYWGIPKDRRAESVEEALLIWSLESQGQNSLVVEFLVRTETEGPRLYMVEFRGLGEARERVGWKVTYQHGREVRRIPVTEKVRGEISAGEALQRALDMYPPWSKFATEDFWIVEREMLHNRFALRWAWEENQFPRMTRKMRQQTSQ